MWRWILRIGAGGGGFALVLGLTAFVLLNRGSVAEADHSCAATGSPFGPFSLQAYEAKDYRAVYARALELAGVNALFPELPSFALPRLETGARAAGSGQTTDPYVPPALLKSIAWIESGWAQADANTPYGAVGPALVSHDCGYGIMQVTSGMQNITGLPNLDQAMIGGHYAFNMARGAKILADKWNQAPEFRPIVGNRDPTVIENWYFALWSYNGFAFRNHPLNPDYQSTRVPYSCGPDDDGLGHDRSQYPYQELVLGCESHPPVRGGALLWEPQQTYLPDLSSPAFAEPLKLDNWSGCTYEGVCAPMDIPTPSGFQTPASGSASPSTPVGPSPEAGPSPSGPLSISSISRIDLFGSPSLALSRDHVALQTTAPTLSAETVTVANAGTGILAWRATASAPWIKLSQYQGVALGQDLGSAPSSLTISADASSIGPGQQIGQVTIESLYSSGAPRTVQVSIASYQDGMLMQGSGPPVYVIAGGLKREVPDPATLYATGATWSSVATIPEGALAAIPSGKPLTSVAAEGALLNAPGTGIFTMQGSVRRHVTSPAVMDACGYRWDAVRVVSVEALSFIPLGDDLSGPPCPRWSPADGSLLQSEGGAVYRVAGGIRRGFANGASLEASGESAGNVDLVPPGMILGIPRGRDMPDALADGNLLLASTPNVYVMEQGQRRLVRDPGVMSACGYGWDAIRLVSDKTMASVPAGASLSGPPCPKLLPPDGAIILGSTVAVFLVNGGQKHYVPSPGAFVALGLRWADVDRVADSTINSIPTGDPIPDSAQLRPNGTLLLGSAPAIFVMEDGFRRLILTPEVMDACGYSWGSVVQVPDDVLAAVPAGAAVAGPPCP